MVTVDRAVSNRQGPVVRDASAITRGERIGHTGVVATHDAVGDHQRSAGVVDASALPATRRGGAVRRAIGVYCAVHDRQCRPAAIGSIVVDAAPSIRGKIAADRAVEDRHRRGSV